MVGDLSVKMHPEIYVFYNRMILLLSGKLYFLCKKKIKPHSYDVRFCHKMYVKNSSISLECRKLCHDIFADIKIHSKFVV